MADSKDKPAEAPKRAVEDWAFAKKSEAWRFRAAKALRAWPIGAEVSEADYDQALDQACNHVIR